MFRIFSVSMLALLLGASIGAAYAQNHKETSAATASGDDLVVSTARLWGGDLGVYTCDQWKRYVTNLFDRADRYHRGYIDEKQFKIIQYASPIFANAEFGYFDDNGDGRITKSEFVDRPSEFFARFDKKHDCRVTADEMNQAPPPAQQKPKMGRRGGGSP